MQQFRTSVFFGWRRPVGWLASYALVLQLVAAALASGQLSAQAASQNWSSFEICYGKGAPDGEQPGGVPAKRDGKCAACTLAAAGGTALAPEAVIVAAPALIFSETRWQAGAENAPRAVFSFSQRQRAPPIAA